MQPAAIRRVFVAVLLAAAPLAADASLAAAPLDDAALLGRDPAPNGSCVACDGTPENEPDCGLTGDPPIDTTNGGCNHEPNLFTPITCGQTICGTAGTRESLGSDYRDTDWYALELDGPSTVEVSLVSDFAGMQNFAGILNTAGGPPSCGASLAADWLATTASCTPFEDSRDLSAGTWWIFVAIQGFSGVVCGAPYSVTVTCPIFRDGFEHAFGLCVWSDTVPSVACP